MVRDVPVIAVDMAARMRLLSVVFQRLSKSFTLKLRLE